MAKSSPLSMKLLIDTQSKTVLFAEASKDCVDFLFHILSLPVATVVALLKEQGMVGSLGKLYGSVKDLDESYLLSNQCKTAILTPAVPNAVGSSVPLLLCNSTTASSEKEFYCCAPSYTKRKNSSPIGVLYPSCNNAYPIYVTDDPRATCPRCQCQMETSMEYVAPPATQKGAASEGGSGYVKGVVTYTVMDNLEVKPMSTISGITLLNKFKIKDLGSLEERVVVLGRPEALNLLKASLQSDQVLTDVFMTGTREAGASPRMTI